MSENAVNATMDSSIRVVSRPSSMELARVVSKGTQPVVFRDLVSDWPVVKSARQGNEALQAYLLGFYEGATVNLFSGEPGIEGRFFYNEQVTGFNFDRSRVKLDDVLLRLARQSGGEPARSYYVGATTIDNCLPGFTEENALELEAIDPLASIWIGNETRIAAHYDLPDNVACVAAGHRRFTLFPPEQLANLYPGPLDFTPAGQQISMVDFRQPDLERYPLFSEALEAALVAELGPGDALFIPSMWWHHVESLDSINVLVNYWWRKSPAYMGPPIDVLLHALLSLRDLPAEQKKAWENIFAHYVFEQDSHVEHIPADSLGVLGPMDETQARKLRAMLIAKLNR